MGGQQTEPDFAAAQAGAGSLRVSLILVNTNPEILMRKASPKPLPWAGPAAWCLTTQTKLEDPSERGTDHCLLHSGREPFGKN